MIATVECETDEELPEEVAAAWATVLIDLFERTQKQPPPCRSLDAAPAVGEAHKDDLIDAVPTRSVAV